MAFVAAVEGAAAALRPVLSCAQQAAVRLGRVVAVSKTKPVGVIHGMCDAGHRWSRRSAPTLSSPPPLITSQDKEGHRGRAGQVARPDRRGAAHRLAMARPSRADLKELPLIHSNDSIKELNRSIEKHEQRHDLVISSYALGEIPSLNNRITIVRQLWDLTKDVLVLLEPGTPQGSKTIRQMRSCILWMEKRKCRKSKKSAGAAPSKMKSMVVQEDLLKNGAFVVAPCESELHVV
ncbi:uncharacterized protein LOC119278597 [Triticum dicoccoides]|uniref:uncharacterized protein LOC119278597 n=1 Tax=Triticum dicoccoides TaxID=85692 RepID=UPI00188DEDCF|nr:uncharacterized protein LOC119278597 [Triticum dicoccoides]